MSKLPGIKPKKPSNKAPGTAAKPPVMGAPLIGPGTPGALSGIAMPAKPVSARSAVRPASTGITADRIESRVKRPVRTKVPRV